MCWKCGEPLGSDCKIYRMSVCNLCGADLHCCRNCKFYDKESHYDCRETIDGPVTDKEKSNFCELFSPRSGPFGPVGNKNEAEQKARDMFNSLFTD